MITNQYTASDKTEKLCDNIDTTSKLETMSLFLLVKLVRYD